MRICIDEKLGLIWQSGPAAQRNTCILGCMKKHGQVVKQGEPAPLLCSGEIPPRVLYPALGGPAQKDPERRVGPGQEEGHKDYQRDREGNAKGAWSRESCRETSLWPSSILRGLYKREGDGLFIQADSEGQGAIVLN